MTPLKLSHRPFDGLKIDRAVARAGGQFFRFHGVHCTLNARRAREPWLVVSSPGLHHLAADAIVSLYAQRMKIEQSFRDTKNARLGLGLEVARSRSGPRFEMLLLLAQLASYVQRLTGEQARHQQLELQYMATRRTSRTGDIGANTRATNSERNAARSR